MILFDKIRDRDVNLLPASTTENESVNLSIPNGNDKIELLLTADKGH